MSLFFLSVKIQYSRHFPAGSGVNYTKFKQDINVEDYLVKWTRSQRSLLAQLRIGILPLQIEVGRYYRKQLNERLCLIYSDNVIEDECHFFVTVVDTKLSVKSFFLI